MCMEPDTNLNMLKVTTTLGEACKGKSAWRKCVARASYHVEVCHLGHGPDGGHQCHPPGRDVDGAETLDGEGAEGLARGERAHEVPVVVVKNHELLRGKRESAERREVCRRLGREGRDPVPLEGRITGLDSDVAN